MMVIPVFTKTLIKTILTVVQLTGLTGMFGLHVNSDKTSLLCRVLAQITVEPSPEMIRLHVFAHIGGISEASLAEITF